MDGYLYEKLNRIEEMLAYLIQKQEKEEVKGEEKKQ